MPGIRGPQSNTNKGGACSPFGHRWGGTGQQGDAVHLQANWQGPGHPGLPARAAELEWTGALELEWIGLGALHPGQVQDAAPVHQ